MEDFEKIKDYCWFKDNNGYIATNINMQLIRQHRLIMNVLNNKEKIIDHINGIKHDNRKENLRICTYQQNCFNVGINKNNTSRITGVYWNKIMNKWVSQIGIDGKLIYLGSFDNKEDAIKARKDAEIKYFGEFRYKEMINYEM